jgi:hypothetical protein
LTLADPCPVGQDPILIGDGWFACAFIENCAPQISIMRIQVIEQEALLRLRSDGHNPIISLYILHSAVRMCKSPICK